MNTVIIVPERPCRLYIWICVEISAFHTFGNLPRFYTIRYKGIRIYQKPYLGLEFWFRKSQNSYLIFVEAGAIGQFQSS